MYNVEELKIAWSLGSRGYSFREVKQLLEDNDVIDMPLTISELFKKICNYYGVSPSMVRGKSRKIEYVKARVMFSYFACIEFKIPQNDVARCINKDRSSLVHYNYKVQNFLDIDDPETTRDVNNIREIVNSIHNKITQ